MLWQCPSRSWRGLLMSRCGRLSTPAQRAARSLPASWCCVHCTVGRLGVLVAPGGSEQLQLHGSTSAAALGMSHYCIPCVDAGLQVVCCPARCRSTAGTVNCCLPPEGQACTVHVHCHALPSLLNNSDMHHTCCDKHNSEVQGTQTCAGSTCQQHVTHPVYPDCTPWTALVFESALLKLAQQGSQVPLPTWTSTSLLPAGRSHCSTLHSTRPS
jgi:hypothetical protein